MVAKYSSAKLLITIVKIAVSAAILAWLINKAMQDNQFSSIATREKQWSWLILGGTSCLAAHLFSFARWNLLVRALDIPFTLRDAVRIGFVGLFFGLFAFGVVGGDTLRMYYAARHARHKLTHVICSVFADRLIGMLTMFSFATIGFLFLDLVAEDAANPKKIIAIEKLCWIVTSITGVGWLGIATLFLMPPKIDSRIFKTLKKIPRLAILVEKLESVVDVYRNRLPVIAVSFAISCLVNLCFIVTIYCIAVGLNVSHPTFAEHALIAPISMTANALPLPGGLGGMEWVLSFLYDAMAAKNEETSYGIAVAFSFRLSLLGLAVVGAFAWFTSRRQIQSAVGAEEASPI